MNPAQKFIGIEIGGTKLQLLKADAAGIVGQRIHYSVEGDAAAIRRQVAHGLHTLGLADVAAIGVGFGGPVNRFTGTISTSHQVPGWTGFNLVDWLVAETGKPVAVDNDANTAALAEALYGCGSEADIVFYMTIGSGIGGGLVVQKELYHGAHPGESEVGHLRLSKNGETVEDRCSGWAVDKKVQAAIESHPTGQLAQLAKKRSGRPQAALLSEAIAAGDSTAKTIILETVDDLAFALSHVVHLFHPDIIILGGGLSLLNEHLRQPVAEKLPSYLMAVFLPAPQVAVAALAEDAVPLGAIELAKRIYHRSLPYLDNKNSL